MDVKAQNLHDSDASPDESDDEAGAAPVKPVKKETPRSFAIFLAQLLLAVLIFRSFIFAPFSIPSESMLPRLMNGDFLLAAKWPYGFSNNSLPFNVPLIPGRILASEPERGDVVIFKHPIDGVDYIKRVIALPGDSVAMVNGVVVLNDQPLAREPMANFTVQVSPNTSCDWGAREVTTPTGESACSYSRFRETLPGGRSYEVLDYGPTPGDTFSPTIVPEGHMFVMGDNRDNSRDSRFEARSGDAVGIVPQEMLVGEAVVLMWSTDGSAQWVNPVSWFTATRWERIGTGL